MEYPDVFIVDEQDNPLGGMPLPEAIEKNLIMRVVRVYIFNDDGRLLLQKRNPHIILPNKWNESATGHVDVNELYMEAALRELKEEVGISGIQLGFRGKYFIEEDIGNKIIRNWHSVYTGHYSEGLIVNHDEVQEVQWLTLPEIDTWIKEKPEDFSPAFLKTYPTIRKIHM